MFAIGDFSLKQNEAAPLISLFFMKPLILTKKAGKFIFALLRTRNLSIATASATTEQNKIGHITSPPFRKISNRFISLQIFIF